MWFFSGGFLGFERKIKYGALNGTGLSAGQALSKFRYLLHTYIYVGGGGGSSFSGGFGDFFANKRGGFLVYTQGLRIPCGHARGHFQT